MIPSRISRLFPFVMLALLTSSFPTVAQQTNATAAVVPTLVQFSGVLTSSNGKPLTEITGVTFSLYAAQQGGSALWMETQNVQPDANGQYTVMLGSTTSQGLPMSLFSSGQARWLEVQAQTEGQGPQPRVMLLSVPYAMTAGNAQTVGGLPASAFALAAPSTSTASSSRAAGTTAPTKNAKPATSSDVTTSGGNINFIPLFSAATDIENSVLTQFGSGSTASLSVNHAVYLRTQKTTQGLTYGQIQLEGAENTFTIHSCCSLNDAFVGGAGNVSAKDKSNNSGMGYRALSGNTGAWNAAFGAWSLASNSSGDGNAAVGYQAGGGGETLTANTTGSYNTFIGYNTVPSTTTQVTNATAIGANAAVGENNAMVLGSINGVNGATASTNVGIGTSTPAYALDVSGTINSASQYNLAGNPFAFGSFGNANVFLGFSGNATLTSTQNTGTGYQALENLSIGSLDTAYGFYALHANTTGPQNTALGALALATNVSGQDNTAVGASALGSNTASYNTAVGYEALEGNGTGQFNTATGYTALEVNTNSYNTADGAFALLNNSTGYGNVASGVDALEANTGGIFNTAAGYHALSFSTGSYNVGNGYQALNNNIAGSFNTAEGENAGITADSSNMATNLNTFLGAQAEVSTGTLANVTVLGANALVGSGSGSGATGTNSTAIGAYASVTGPNAMVLGPITGVNNCTAANNCATVNVGIGTTAPSNIFTIGKGFGMAIADGWSTYSSRRWKTNIKTLPDALSRVEQLRGVSYDLKDSGKHEIGVIAEEVGKVVPEIVMYEENGKDARGVDYSRLTALLIEATKEQQALIRKQQQQIRTQQAQLKAQRSQIKAQQTQGQLQQAQIAELMSQVKAIQASLQVNGGSRPEVRTVKVQTPMVRQ